MTILNQVENTLEVIAGPMFSSKSTTLISRIETLIYTNKKIGVFKPKLDTRYADNFIQTHLGKKIEAYPVENSKEILSINKEMDFNIIVIDEVQFFDSDIVEVVEELLKTSRIIVAGLDQTFAGEPFGEMPSLLAKADIVTKLYAVCAICQRAATKTQRLVNGKPARADDPIIILGASESYEARCREHHIIER